MDETTVAPKWRELISGDDTFQFTFDILDVLINPLHNAFSIAKNMKRRARYRKGKWYTSYRGNNFHLYSGFSDAISNSRKQKIDIFGLTLSYNVKDGSLFLDDEDYKSSKKVFLDLSPDMKEIPLAWVQYISGTAPSRRSQTSTPGILCHAEWSNIFRVDLEEMQGKCLHFTAASSGTIYVVFSASLKNLAARYVVEISSDRVVIFKGNAAVADSPKIQDVDVVALGESVLYESYFVCITISGKNTLIEYGKKPGHQRCWERLPEHD